GQLLPSDSSREPDPAPAVLGRSTTADRREWSRLRLKDVEQGQVRTLEAVQEILEHPRATARIERQSALQGALRDTQIRTNGRAVNLPRRLEGTATVRYPRMR